MPVFAENLCEKLIAENKKLCNKATACIAEAQNKPFNIQIHELKMLIRRSQKLVKLLTSQRKQLAQEQFEHNVNQLNITNALIFEDARALLKSI